uniref:Putative secreted protein n=1 Tax=Anopheles darlingi TaxID=43151 RepID=A0A2M4DCD5_ANODA
MKYVSFNWSSLVELYYFIIFVTVSCPLLVDSFNEPCQLERTLVSIYKMPEYGLWTRVSTGVVYPLFALRYL